MIELTTLITNYLDICFLDWGTMVMLRDVSQAFNPESQVISETYVDTEVTAIPGFSQAEPARSTAQQSRSDQRAFFIRANEYPFDSEVSNARLVHGGIQYDILNAKTSSSDLMMIECRRHVREFSE